MVTKIKEKNKKKQKDSKRTTKEEILKKKIYKNEIPKCNDNTKLEDYDIDW